MYPMLDEDLHRIKQRAALYRKSYPEFANWAKGYGVIQHTDETQVRVFDLCQQLLCENRFGTLADILSLFVAADHLTSSAMWLVVHMTYANKIDLSGAPLNAENFKENPQGHTGGSLNMVPGYVAYMTANALAGVTRSWLMGQGHCVAAIETVNILLRNLLTEQSSRYTFNDEGLTQLVNDFYSYSIDDNGKPAVPLGSHVNPHTAGGLIEGGYLSFAELQYVHMPLRDERLVAFLSDGAFEEQRGSDWAARWWRAEDCGLVTPIMIANGRRIDQRSTMYQQGGLSWFYQHLQHNGFHPIAIDGRDPAAFIWGIFESESRLKACSQEIEQGLLNYPVRLPYLIAESTKGYGFYGAGTNASHGTPLPANPKYDEDSRKFFNESAAKLFVSKKQITESVAILRTHALDLRGQEKDHVLAHREVSLKKLDEINWHPFNSMISPMESIDQLFVRILESNPSLRVRLCNPDELRSNKMGKSLDKLKHRVLTPENGVAESVFGSVITALNEEAIVSAALGNKGGINMVVTYEAFAVKMLGALRQEIIFARHQKDLGRSAKWLSVPIIATSHLWENGKNEQSHQDPTFGESLLAEMNDVSRVVYPTDANSAMACLNACYQTQGQIWCLTIAKNPIKTRFSEEQSLRLVNQGAITLVEGNDIQLVAVGAYQLEVCFEVHHELTAIGLDSSITYLLEPARFREPRDNNEAIFTTDEALKNDLFPEKTKLRVFISHLRPEVLLGHCRPLDLGNQRCFALGYLNHGGTLDTHGLLKANGCDAGAVVKMIQARYPLLKESRNETS
jgi:phosphoketolase